MNIAPLPDHVRDFPYVHQFLKWLRDQPLDTCSALKLYHDWCALKGYVREYIIDQTITQVFDERQTTHP